MIKNKIILTLLAIIVVMGVFIGGFFLGGKEAENKIDSAVIESSLNDIAELSTVEYNYTNMGVFENHKEFYGWKIPFTTSKFVISYEGTIKAGIDFSKVKVEVNEKTITVTVPDAAVLSHTIDYDSLQVLDEKYSIFTTVKIEDYNSFYNDQSRVMELKAIERGLLRQAKENAQNIIRSSIINLVGEGYEIVFR